ncbi:MAG: helix-turn-helix domain-containing protein [Actinobacteria bacterium]|nr:helix-turn-helix domain-containing protein [Actinomycetota bacterium]
MVNATESRFISTEDLAEEFGVPVATVRRWRYMGDGPSGIKLGRHVRYERSEVERWLAERHAAEREKVVAPEAGGPGAA